jgi:hypothetical protein
MGIFNHGSAGTIIAKRIIGLIALHLIVKTIKRATD